MHLPHPRNLSGQIDPLTLDVFDSSTTTIRALEWLGTNDVLPNLWCALQNFSSHRSLPRNPSSSYASVAGAEGPFLPRGSSHQLQVIALHGKGEVGRLRPPSYPLPPPLPPLDIRRPRHGVLGRTSHVRDTARQARGRR
nr:hypothetical protein CFP56_07386 [Quercus suber]